ncbi:hypothetical protein ZIOFF_060838 [Zingiber officinale]|uniref:RING-CH-type domain-containing protein n=1 Tax=Zingiber officinale TaxID=94328 RepID=A0A8J5FPQ2_ZINOF|nr:hypothetical protein ZIOFF_060838 [Zingiber officinale]
MGDHFALLAGRLLTESTLEATVGSKEEDQGREITRNRIAGGESLECRICQEEDEDFNMETPCSCRGSLKVKKELLFSKDSAGSFQLNPAISSFLLPVCSQKMCPEMVQRKGRHCVRDLPAAIRARIYGSAEVTSVWDCSDELQEDLHDSQILTLAPSEPDDTLHHYDDDHSRSKICCRAIAITVSVPFPDHHPFDFDINCHHLCFVQFVVLLFLRHCLPPLIGGPEQYSFTLFSLLVLRTAGILLPVVVMVRTVRTLRQCRRHQVKFGACFPSFPQRFLLSLIEIGIAGSWRNCLLTSHPNALTLKRSNSNDA